MKKKRTSSLSTPYAMLCPQINNKTWQSFSNVSLPFPFAKSNMLNYIQFSWAKFDWSRNSNDFTKLLQSNS